MLLNRQLTSTVTQELRVYDLLHSQHPLIDFILNIRTGKPGTKAYRAETYAVQYDADSPDNAFGFLLLKNDSDPGEDDFYIVSLPVDYQTAAPARARDGVLTPPGKCTCFAGNKLGRCKHRDVLQDAVSLAFGCGETIRDTIPRDAVPQPTEHSETGDTIPP